MWLAAVVGCALVLAGPTDRAAAVSHDLDGDGDSELVVYDPSRPAGTVATEDTDSDRDPDVVWVGGATQITSFFFGLVGSYDPAELIVMTWDVEPGTVLTYEFTGTDLLGEPDVDIIWVGMGGIGGFIGPGDISGSYDGSELVFYTSEMSTGTIAEVDLDGPDLLGDPNPDIIWVGTSGELAWGEFKDIVGNYDGVEAVIATTALQPGQLATVDLDGPDILGKPDPDIVWIGLAGGGRFRNFADLDSDYEAEFMVEASGLAAGTALTHDFGEGINLYGNHDPDVVWVGAMGSAWFTPPVFDFDIDLDGDIVLASSLDASSDIDSDGDGDVFWSSLYPTPTPTPSPTPFNTPTPVPTPVQSLLDAQTAVIGAGGGTLAAAGASLFVPPGALSQDTTIGVEVADALLVAPPAFESASLLPAAFHFWPDGLTFALPAELTFTYAEDDVAGLNEGELEVAIFNGATGTWELAPVVTRDTEANTLTVEITHLGIIAAFDPSLSDLDGDGCNDKVERDGLNPVLGGVRDPLNYWDFFDVTDDGLIDFSDALDVLGYFGDPGLAGTPGNVRDRDVGGPNAWNLVESDTGVDFTDVLNGLQSFGHSCS
jgi:hypothetical protein